MNQIIVPKFGKDYCAICYYVCVQVSSFQPIDFEKQYDIYKLGLSMVIYTYLQI